VSFLILQADARAIPMGDKSVQCCVTSPPYWGLRDYSIKPSIWPSARSAMCEGPHSWGGVIPGDNRGGSGTPTDKNNRGEGYGRDQERGSFCRWCGAWLGCLGLEPTPELFVAHIVEVFKEIYRVLKDDGTCWVNLGDSYASAWVCNRRSEIGSGSLENGKRADRPNRLVGGLKEKDLVGIPWSVAKALQAPQYTGKIKSELERVWLAAMIDAEGTICGFTHLRKDNGDIRQGIHVTITNSNTAILDRCFEIWATTREEHNQHSNGHLGDLPTWRWIVHGMEQKSRLLAELYPYFVGKKKQALLAWNFLEISKTTRGRNKGEEGRDNREKYAWIVTALSKLNHLEAVDIPSWCKEPPSLYEPGWYLRSDIIWSKPNPMPESVTDRPTKAHEYIFLLSKQERYFFDADAVREAPTSVDKRAGRNSSCLVDKSPNPRKGMRSSDPERFGLTRNHGAPNESCTHEGGRNIRSVWTIATQPYAEAHFATFPQELARTCIKAGSRKGDIVLDPFGGAGTTALVADKLGRTGISLELKNEYCQMARKRCFDDAPLLTF